jgi:Tfp pilus assembly protein PilN
MINLLPPDLKEQIAYSQRNALMRRYILLSTTVWLILAGALVASGYYLNNQIKTAQQQVSAKQQQIASYSQLQTTAAGLTSRLAAIQSIQKNQAKFSALLSNLAQSMPQGTAITSITLTGNASQPVQLTVSAVNYQTALGFRDSLTKSKLISAADIESITPQTSGPAPYTVTVTFTFNPGDAQ